MITVRGQQQGQSCISRLHCRCGKKK